MINQIRTWKPIFINDYTFGKFYDFTVTYITFSRPEMIKNRNFDSFGGSRISNFKMANKTAQKSKFRSAKMVKMVVFETLISAQLISHKIWVTANFRNTVKHQTYVRYSIQPFLFANRTSQLFQYCKTNVPQKLISRNFLTASCRHALRWKLSNVAKFRQYTLVNAHASSNTWNTS